MRSAATHPQLTPQLHPRDRPLNSPVFVGPGADDASSRSRYARISDGVQTRISISPSFLAYPGSPDGVTRKLRPFG